MDKQQRVSQKHVCMLFEWLLQSKVFQVSRFLNRRDFNLEFGTDLVCVTLI